MEEEYAKICPKSEQVMVDGKNYTRVDADKFIKFSTDLQELNELNSGYNLKLKKQIEYINSVLKNATFCAGRPKKQSSDNTQERSL